MPVWGYQMTNIFRSELESLPSPAPASLRGPSPAESLEAAASIFGLAAVRQRRVTIIEEEQLGLASIDAVGAVRPARCPHCGR